MSSRKQATDTPSREEFTALDSARAKLDDDVAAVRRSVDSHSTDITEMKSSMRTITSELSSLNAKFDQIMASLTPLPASQPPPSSDAPPTSATATAPPTSSTATTTSSASERSAPDKPSSAKSATEKSTSEKPASDKLVSDKPPWNSQAAAFPNGKAPSVRSQPTTTTGVEETGRSFSIKPEELGSFDGTPEDATLFLANVEAIRTTERDSGWDKALLRALPRTLRGSARLWFASLSPVERSSSLGSLDALLEAIRANFKPAQAIVRQQARARRWQPDDEDVIHYTFVKAALLKTGWPDISEGEVVKEVIDGIDPAVAKLVQTPFRNDPTLVAVRTELRIQETFWRAEFGRPLVRPPSVSSAAGVPAFDSLVKPAQPANVSAFIAQTGDSDASVDAYPQSPQTSKPTFATRQPNPRQGRSIRSDFDPAKLSYRVHPELNKRMMSYKVPLTNRIMWEKPGEPPPPTALLAQPAPERKAEGKGDWNYTHSDRCDPPARHYTQAKGCKSTVERVAPPLGPEGDLDGGYHTIPTPGPDRGHGPSSAQTTRGHPPGEYPTCLPFASDQSSTDDPSSSPPQAKDDHQDPVIFLAEHWLRQPAALPSFAVSPKRPRGELTDVKLSRLEETGSGLGHLRHAPTSCQLQFFNTELTPVSCLVDTGASLSTIDAGLAKRLGQVSSGGTLSINGIGTERTLGFVTLSFGIEGTDDKGGAVLLHFDHDFHVVPSFAPGVLLGQDWITGYGLVVDPANDRASMRDYNFRVKSDRPHAHTFHGKICTRQAVIIAPSHHTWVPVDCAALIANVDYTLDPTWHFDPVQHQLAAAIPCLMDRQTSRLLVTNFGTEPLEIPSRTCLGEATACGPGTVSLLQSAAFPLHSGPSSPTFLHTQVGSPLDAFEFDEQPAAAQAQEDATVLVDEVFRVGLDETGAPHPSVVELLRQHTEAFSLDGRPGHVQGVSMRIPVPDPSKLQADPPRRVSPEKRQAIDKEIAQLLEWDVIEESSSPVSAPVHLVKQRTKLRFCVDYRSLNAATTPDRYPLPRVDAVIETLRGNSWFSSMDAVRGYHQADIDPEDRWKTAFATHRGLFQYRRVPFGLSTAPAFFQRMMDALLGPIRWLTALVYLDDIVVFTRTLREHLEALRYILSEAQRVGLRFSPSKCTFAVRELTLLGRKVSGFGLGVMEDRVTAVRELPRPRNLQELYHTLGLFSYYRTFIPRYTQRAAPLTALTKGLAYKKVGTAWKLMRSDGSQTTNTAELLQWSDAQERAFNDLKDALASPPTLAHPDYDRPFLLYTDACKSGFAAAIHQVHVNPAPPPGPLVATAWPNLAPPLDPVAWSAALLSDPTFAPTMRRLSASDGNTEDDFYAVVGGILVRRDDGRVCVPRSMLLAVLRHTHDDGGHFGFGKTYARVASQFWHPRLSSLVEAYVRYCGACLRTKRGRKVGSLDIEHDAIRPFQHTSVDVVLGMPSSRRRHDAYIIAECTFSKMILLEPCTASFTAKDVVRFLMNRVVRMGWRIERLTSDHDLRIIGEAGQQLAAFLGAQITATPPHHHQANPVERHVQVVQRVLRAMSADRSGLWDEEALPAVELAINSSVSTSTGMTPFDAVFINSPRLMDALLRGDAHEGVGDWAEQFRFAKARLLEAKTRIRGERLHQKRAYDSRHAPLPTIAPGRLVWIRLANRPVRAAPSGKTAPLKLGPFAVRRVLSPHRVLVDVPPELNIEDEFDVAQLDLHPSGADPFADVRTPARTVPTVPAPTRSDPAPPSSPNLTPVEHPVEHPALPRRGHRERRPAPLLRDPSFAVHTLRLDLAEPLHDRASDAFADPVPRAKLVDFEGTQVQMVERPVAFMSRTTSLAESRLAGPELELACISWAFTRAQHLLEGAKITIITDHAPVQGMLTSRPGAIPYGPAVDRARTVLRPHLDHLKIIYRPGRLHINVDALSRLVRDSTARPGRRASSGGGM